MTAEPPRWKVSALLVMGTAVALFVALVIVGPGWRTDTILMATALGFSSMGALILARTDGNRVGWVLGVAGAALLASGLMAEMADQGSLIASGVGGALWFTFFVLIGFLLYWFPDGRPVTPRWRWLGWVGAASAGTTLTYVVSEELCASGGEECRRWVDNPIGIAGVPNPEYGNSSDVTLLLMATFVLISAATLVIRFLRSGGVQRLQIKWLVFSVIGVICVILLQEYVGGIFKVPEPVLNLLFSVSLLGFPVSVGLAVLRYRLYDIDRIVSRTVSYVLVVGLMGAIFVGLVTGVSALLPSDDSLAVAGSTLAVAAMFNPLRRRVQGAVDRRFNRSRYDAERVVEGFVSSLRDRVDPDGVVEGWLGVVSETMQPAVAGMWIRE